MEMTRALGSTHVALRFWKKLRFRTLKVWNHEWFVQPLKMEMTSPLLTKINGEIVLFLNSFAGDATKYDFWTFLY